MRTGSAPGPGYAAVNKAGDTMTGVLNATGLQVGGAAVTPMLSATSASIGGGALIAGGVATGTVAVAGATTSMTVTVSPNTYPGDAIDWRGYVSVNGTVTIIISAIIAATPAASTYNVRVHQ